MKERLTTDRIYLLVTGIIIQIVLMIPWIPTSGGKMNTCAYLIRMLSAENLETLITTDFGFQGFSWQELNPMTYVFMIELVMFLIVQVLGIINILLTLFAKEKHSFLCMVNLVICAANVFSMPTSFMFYLEGLLPKLYVVIILALTAVNLVGYKMIDAWADATEEQRRIKKREREKKEERKRRLAFEGKYSPLFYRVIWKNFKSSWETYRLFIVVGGLSISFIFSGIGMREMLSNAHGAENLAAGQGLGTILLNFLVMTLVISVFLITSVLLFYLKHHIKNYALFINLGMRSRTLYLFVGVELLSCIILSLVIGIVLGNVILILCGAVIRNGFEGGITLEAVTGKTYLLTVAVGFLVYLISAMATHDIYYDTGGSGSRYKEVMKEKMPGKLSPLFMVIGVGLMIYSFLEFTRRERAESVVLLAAFFAGLFLFWRNIWNLYLRWRKKKNAVYYGNLLKKNYFYHHFKTAFRYMFLITLLHVSVLFVFSREVVSSQIAKEAPTMFPYDYVCMATDGDKELFQEIEKETHAEVLTYPMVRVTSVDNSPRMDDIRICMQPQGQNIGISEMTYRALCENLGRKPQKLDLSDDGKKVYLIYQEDESVKAHPVDYFPNRTNPYLHIGQPVLAYDYLLREEIFMPREVTGEETGSLIGNLSQGEHENIVVFSDEYFKKIQKDWQTTEYHTGTEITKEEAVEDVTIHHWPDRLVLIRADETEKGAVEEKLREFQENHKFDEHFDSSVQSWYSKDERISQIKSERFMDIAVSAFIIVILISVIIVLLYMKAESEMEEKKRQQEFFECMGMREKERLALIKHEVAYFLWIPFGIATLTVAAFTVVLWNIRLYTQTNCVDYLKLFIVIYAAYAAVQLLVTKGLEYFIIKKVEGSHAGNHKS